MKAIIKSNTLIMSVLFAVMVVSVGSLYLGYNEAYAKISDEPTFEKLISVTGIASASVEPDLLVITFGMETQEITAKQALDANSQTMNDIIKSIKSIGITTDEISTSRFNIYPVYEKYEDKLTKRWTQEIVGYKVTNTLTVETSELSFAADIIDNAVTFGANRVDNVSFTLSPEKHLELKDELIEKAIMNAKTKAENALVPLDYSITGIKAISLSEFGMNPPPMQMHDMMYKQSFSLTESGRAIRISSSDQDVSTTANVIFTIGSN